jgi:cell division protein FtsN
MCSAFLAVGALRAQAPTPAQACPVPVTAAAQRVSPGEVTLSPTPPSDTGVRRRALAPTGRRGSSPGEITSRAAVRAGGRRWTIQVASFESLDEATTEQQQLCERGYDARVVGAFRPFSVRVGHFPSADSALTIARKLTTKHMTPFVTADTR